jgi:hypothetical protein
MITIPAVTAIPADAVVNTWGFEITQTPATDAHPVIEGHLKTFYDAWANYRGALHAWTLARAKWYDLSQPKPRAPIRDQNLALSSAVQTTTLPTEVALCFSFQGTRISGLKQARRRGRVYLGTLATVAQSSSSGRPAAALLTALVTAGSALAAACEAATGFDWVVISNTPTEASFSAQVTDGWVDDAFDTQRRRGSPVTSRSTWT